MYKRQLKEKARFLLQSDWFVTFHITNAFQDEADPDVIYRKFER